MSTPFPYYIDHALVALALAFAGSCIIRLAFTRRDSGFAYRAVVSRAGALAGFLSGGMFYLGREVAQWEDRRYFDWPGLLVPLVVLGCYVMLVFWRSRPRF